MVASPEAWESREPGAAVVAACACAFVDGFFVIALPGRGGMSQTEAMAPASVEVPVAVAVHRPVLLAGLAD